MSTHEELWIVVGDIHDDCRRLLAIPELAAAEGIIISGDLTFNGGVQAAEKVLQFCQAQAKTVFAQIGNMDKPEVNDWLEGLGCNIHRKVRALSADVALFGIGGSTQTPFATPSEFSENDYSEWLSALWEEASCFHSSVLISHNPPKNTQCDFIPGPDIHVGAQSVRDFIEFVQPSVCICGHIHEGRAQEMLGKTQVINPGTLADGGYVLLHIAGQSVQAELKVLP